MPLPLQIAILFVCGTALGALVNLGIYQLAVLQPRRLSPWGPKHPDATPRRWADALPLVGWIVLMRDEPVHGRAYWCRPFALELFFGAGLALFYLWMFSGGLTAPPHWPSPANAWIWFGYFTFFIVLLAIATFIDFDEKMIPDTITVTGTLFALVFAALVPHCRLPLPAADQWLHLDSPVADVPNWIHSPWGLAAGMASLLFWSFALLPMYPRVRWGKYGNVRYFWAIALRPRRKTQGRIAIAPRSTPTITKVCLAIAGIGTPAVALCWALWRSTDNWESLMCALLGMVFGMVLVWLIRIIATWALQKEAMGFGDVTLMAMIGAFLGWQPALLTFALAPFAAVIIAIIQVVTTKKPDIAFGPYLSLAAVFVVLGWPNVWQWASTQVFALGSLFILGVVGGSLVLMFFMLWAMASLRGD